MNNPERIKITGLPPEDLRLAADRLDVASFEEEDPDKAASLQAVSAALSMTAVAAAKSAEVSVPAEDTSGPKPLGRIASPPRRRLVRMSDIVGPEAMAQIRQERKESAAEARRAFPNSRKRMAVKLRRGRAHG